MAWESMRMSFFITARNYYLILSFLLKFLLESHFNSLMRMNIFKHLFHTRAIARLWHESEKIKTAVAKQSYGKTTKNNGLDTKHQGRFSRGYDLNRTSPNCRSSSLPARPLQTDGLHRLQIPQLPLSYPSQNTAPLQKAFSPFRAATTDRSRPSADQSPHTDEHRDCIRDLSHTHRQLP